MKKLEKKIDGFEKFKFENLKSIIGGLNIDYSEDSSDGPIDPIKKPTNGGGNGNGTDRPK